MSGQVVVHEHGEEVFVDVPSLDGEIRVDLDDGGSGEASVAVPRGTTTVHDSDLDDDRDDEELPARADGGHSARVRDRTRLRGTGISETNAGGFALVGSIAALAGATGSGLVATGAAVVAGGGLAYLGARAHFGFKATGGEE